MFKYLKSVISANTQERTAAFIAVLAAVSLCIGFFLLLLLLFFGKVYLGYFITVTVILGAMATLTKIDASSVINNLNKDINTDKEIEKS